MWDSSAGTEPSSVNPRAIEVMAEAGADIFGHVSKSLDAVSLEDVDAIIPLCGDAEERCSSVLGHVHREHWPLPDPARAAGTHDEVLAVFRSVRDEITRRVRALFAEASLNG
jgi:arsenate reductase